MYGLTQRIKKPGYWNGIAPIRDKTEVTVEILKQNWSKCEAFLSDVILEWGCDSSTVTMGTRSFHARFPVSVESLLWHTRKVFLRFRHMSTRGIPPYERGQTAALVSRILLKPNYVILRPDMPPQISCDVQKWYKLCQISRFMTRNLDFKSPVFYVWCNKMLQVAVVKECRMSRQDPVHQRNIKRHLP